MTKRIYYFVFFIFVLLLIQGCDVVEYDITVINDTDFDFLVYMDGELQFKLSPGGSSVIKDVASGDHKLEAIAGDEIIAEETIELDEDIEWTIYIARYNIEITNNTISRLSIYIDGIYQFDLSSRDSKAVTGISEGNHTLDARIGNDIIASQNVYVDQDIKWTID